MPTKVPQKDRLYAALAELRTTPGFEPKPLSTDRQSFADRLLNHKWTRKNFTRVRTTIAVGWKGDELTTLHEMSYYLLPRALWATRREQGGAWVRREQVFTFVQLVQHHFGREIAATFKKLLLKHGVKYRPRRQLSAATKDALRARSQFKAKKTEARGRALGEWYAEQLRTSKMPVKSPAKPAPRQPVAVVTGKRRINLHEE